MGSTLGCTFGHLFQIRREGEVQIFSDSRADMNRLVKWQEHGKNKIRKLSRRLGEGCLVWAQSAMRSLSHINGDEKGL